jgi:2-methylisocitrate lyase-like PEP mutase family enzyme
MDRTTQKERVKLFRRLHEDERPLVLVNAWDAVSARLFEEAGSPAIGTTSAGVAWSLGYADGERVSRRELLGACERICRAVRVPVTVDVERGYGGTPEDVCATVRDLVELGVAGINIEDGRVEGKLAPSNALAQKIAALRALVSEMGADLFINARTDVYFVAWDDPRARYDAGRARAEEYIAAGADGVFVPGLDNLDEIAAMSRKLERPLNVYAGYEGVPPVADLKRAGARRVSLGCGPYQALLAHARRIATEALGEGTYAAMTADMLDNGAVNALFARV